MNAKRTITLPDGYNGHTEKFNATPLEFHGQAVKLSCTSPGKEYMIKWAWKSDVEEALREQP